MLASNATRPVASASCSAAFGTRPYLSSLKLGTTNHSGRQSVSKAAQCLGCFLDQCSLPVISFSQTGRYFLDDIAPLPLVL